MSNPLEGRCCVQRIYHFVNSLDPSFLEVLKPSIFGFFFKLPNVPICYPLIEALIERFDYSKKCFIINDKDVYFKDEEIVLCLGLNVKMTVNKVVKAPRDIDILWRRYFNGENSVSCQSIDQALSSEDLRRNFEDFTKLALLMLACDFLIPNRAGTIDKMFIQLIDCNSQIPWGMIVFDKLFEGIKSCALFYKTTSNHTFLEGCVFALQIWAFEHIPELSPSPSKSLFPRYLKHLLTNEQRKSHYVETLQKTEVIVLLKLTKNELKLIGSQWQSETPKDKSYGSRYCTAQSPCENKFREQDFQLKNIVYRVERLEKYKTKEKEKVEKKKKKEKIETQRRFKPTSRKGSKDNVIKVKREPLDNDATSDVDEIDAGKPKIRKSTAYHFFPKPTVRRKHSYEGKEKEAQREETNSKVAVEQHGGPAKPVQRRLFERDFKRSRYFSSGNRDGEFFHQPLALLSDDDRVIVTSYWAKPNSNDKLPTTNLLVNYLKLLIDRALIDDTIIDAYCKLLKKRETEHVDRFRKCHYLSALFKGYLEMATRDIAPGQEYSIKYIRYLTGLINLGDLTNICHCEKIFYILNNTQHWALLVIHVDEKKLQLCDSLGKISSQIWDADIDLLCKFFRHILSAVNNNDIDISTWERVFDESIPLQKNGYDCGIFVLKYMDYISRGLPFTFTQDDMLYFRMRTTLELVNGTATP